MVHLRVYPLELRMVRTHKEVFPIHLGNNLQCSDLRMAFPVHMGNAIYWTLMIEYTTRKWREKILMMEAVAVKHG